MKIFAIKFAGVWLTGDAIVVAPSKKVAIERLSEKLRERRLRQEINPDRVVEIDTTKSSVLIVDDGDY